MALITSRFCRVRPANAASARTRELAVARQACEAQPRRSFAHSRTWRWPRQEASDGARSGSFIAVRAAAPSADAPQQQQPTAACPSRPTLYLLHCHLPNTSGMQTLTKDSHDQLQKLREDLKVMEKVAKKAAWFSTVEASDGERVLLVTACQKHGRKYNLQRLPEDVSIFPIELPGRSVDIPLSEVTAALLAQSSDSDSDEEDIKYEHQPRGKAEVIQVEREEGSKQAAVIAAVSGLGLEKEEEHKAAKKLRKQLEKAEKHLKREQEKAEKQQKKEEAAKAEAKVEDSDDDGDGSKQKDKKKEKEKPKKEQEAVEGSADGGCCSTGSRTEVKADCRGGHREEEEEEEDGSGSDSGSDSDSSSESESGSESDEEYVEAVAEKGVMVEQGTQQR
ncbi:hypothetical protein Agub_g8915 [Astrephomene gubernaculifera]|uniref:Uncharacterized protein n=1 Tax=Astrephomene gubernaculifera TaxID=47775 RepID=A0AAD3DSJ2_9CHLO|nr:hypothetical protein Agub_g8915 [Astrephomene gubernaculifera]